MAVIRVYEARDGDCIALRQDGDTLLIFDTGRKTSANATMGPLRRALNDSVGPRTNRNGKTAPVVVVSHVDADHIDGLMGWVDSVFSASSTWNEARRIAQEEVKEVWCNVPPEDRAFRLLETGGAAGSEFDGGGWVSDPLADGAGPGANHAANLPEDWTESWRAELGFGGSAAAEPLNRFIADQQLIRGRLWPEASKKVDGESDEGEAGVFEAMARVAETVFDALDEQDEWPDLQRSRYGGSYRMWWPEGQIIVDESGLLLVWVLLGEGTGVRFYIQVGPSGLVLGDALSAGIGVPLEQPDFESAREQALSVLSNSGSPHELLHNVLEELDRTSDLPLSTRAGLSICKMLLGIQPAAALKKRISLFAALRALGIPILGAGGQYLHSGSGAMQVKNQTVRFLAPTKSRIADLEDEWKNLSPRLAVKRPSHLGLNMALSFLACRSLVKLDDSTSNLSSIALALPNFGSDSGVVLTGDNLHRDIMAELGKAAPHFAQTKRLYYQIPHHGSRSNTHCSADPLPSAMLSATTKMQVAFASGGYAAADKRPHQEVLKFFKGDAKRAVGVRKLLAKSKNGRRDFRGL